MLDIVYVWSDRHGNDRRSNNSNNNLTASHVLILYLNGLLHFPNLNGTLVNSIQIICYLFK